MRGKRTLKKEPNVAKHYTGVLEIYEVQEGQPRGRDDPMTRRVTPAADRTKAEVARIVVRASSLTELKRKMAAHVELVDDSVPVVQIERKPR